MINSLQLKIWLKINEKLLLEAIANKDTVRLLELMMHRDLLKQDLINELERGLNEQNYKRITKI